MSEMLDRRGVPIYVGDIAVHATSGRYGEFNVVRVSGFTDKRVRVDQVDYLGVASNMLFASPPRILDPNTLIVAKFHQVPGRLNN